MERAADLDAASHHLRSMAIPPDAPGWPFFEKIAASLQPSHFLLQASLRQHRRDACATKPLP